MRSVNNVQPENRQKLATGLLLYIIDTYRMFDLCCHNLVQLANGFGTKFYLLEEEIGTYYIKI